MSPEFVISISSVVIAGVALFVGVWQGFLTRQHNRLSVRPHLRLDRHEIDGEPVKIILRNTGVGPAFIETFDLKIDGDSVVVDSMTRVQVVLQKLGLVNVSVRFGSPVKGESITAGETYTLLEINENSENNNTIIAVLPRLTFSISYKSIYGETYNLTL